MVLNSDLVFPVIVLPIIIFTVVLVGCGFLCNYLKKCHKYKSQVDPSTSIRRTNRRFSLDAAEVNSMNEMNYHHCVRRRLSEQDYHTTSDAYVVNPMVRLGAGNSISIPLNPRPFIPVHPGLSFYTIPMPDYEQPPAYDDIFGDANMTILPHYEDLNTQDSTVTSL